MLNDLDLSANAENVRCDTADLISGIDLTDADNPKEVAVIEDTCSQISESLPPSCSQCSSLKIPLLSIIVSILIITFTN